MSFVQQQKDVIAAIEEVQRLYDTLSRNVPPNQWRITGHHNTELTKMVQEINQLREATNEERVNYPKWAIDELSK